MRRIGLAVVLACSLILAPLAAKAQSKVPRIGMLWLGAREAVQPFITAYEQSLHQLGYSVGQTLLLEQRFADGQGDERLSALATELVRLNVDLIAVGPNPMSEAARRATSTIPIVVAYGSDPQRRETRRTSSGAADEVRVGVGGAGSRKPLIVLIC